MTAILLLGFLLGMRHALDADHVAAVASIVVSTKSVRGSIRQGAAWGFGHTLTLFAVGVIVVLTGSEISPGLAGLLEACVGLMLILLGLDVIRTMFRQRVHFHAHEHDGVRHVHAHSHADSGHRDHSADPHDHVHRERFPQRALFIGLMHGIAGSAALMLLALDGSRSAWEGLAYIGLFGVGSIAGMAFLSAAMAWPIARSGNHLTASRRVAQVVVVLANFSIGSLLIRDALAGVV